MSTPGEDPSLVDYGSQLSTLSETASRQSPTSTSTPTPTSPGTPGRKPPPSPLALNTSTHLSTSLSVSPNPRKSLDSSRSDLTSIRSELTSLHISDFPLPPSLLPTIPASPATPKSLFFTTTPTSTNINLLQEPADSATANRSLLPSPRSLKGLFTRSNNSSQTRLVPEQPQQAALESLETALGTSQYHPHPIYSDTVSYPHSSSRAATPPTAGTMTPRDWRSGGSDGSSSLKSRNSPPFPPAPSDSEPRPVTISPPPQSPLPVPPPSNRSSFRTSLRYSQILYDIGHSDMGMDITEEKLLSTDFITEMLRQPVQTASSSSQVSPPPGVTLQEAMLEKEHQGKVGVQPNPLSQLTVIDESGELQSPSLYSPNFVENEIDTNRINSVLASSVFPSGADMIYYDSPATSPSATMSSSRHHLGHHPLVPSTPMTPASFTSITSPKSPTLFETSSSSSPTTTTSSSNRSPSASQMVASRLPIGRTMSTSSTLTVSTQRTMKPAKIRQHRYPRSVTTKTSPNSPESVPMQELNATSPVDDVDSPTTVVQRDTFAGRMNENAGATGLYNYQSENDVDDERRLTVGSIVASAHSHATSTRTQRDSVPVIPTIDNLYDFTDGYSHKSSLVPPHSAHSVRTRESAFDEGDVYVGIAKTVDVADFEPDIIDRSTSPKIVGVAPARVILQPKRMGSSPSLSNGTTTPLQITDKRLKTDPNSPSASPIPVSPRDPPSIRSPPSHRTDIPESAKSLIFSDEVDDVHHLSYEIRSSGGTYWTMFPGIGNNLPVQAQDTKSTRANAATSFKSVISYITSKSVAKDSHKSTGNRSSKWAWLLRKPLPPLPIEAQVTDPSNLDDVHPAPTSIGIPVAHEKTMLSPPPLVGSPYAWDDIVIEKRPSPGVGLMGRMFGQDSLKMARRKPNRKLTDPPGPQGNITPYILPHLSGMHRRQSSTRSSSAFHVPPEKSRKRKILFAGAFVGVVIVVVIIVLAVVLSRKHTTSPPGPCSNGNVGSFCNLDASCTCPGGQSGLCTAPLAKGLSELIPQAAQIFNVNITASVLAIILWEQNGTPVDSDCSSQAELMDLGGSVSPLSTPNRTSWAQSALIWNLFETANVNLTQQLQSQIQQLPFNDLAVDGIVPDPAGHFLVSTSGYILDFANQTVNPPSVKFINDAAPSAQQVSEINSAVESTLDRMYSFAIASSTQSQTALGQYWQDVLSLDIGNLPNFLSAIRSSSILLPFDATNKVISDFLSGHENNNSNSISFPPPIACYPGLSDSQLSSINLVETQAFGLPTVAAPPSTLDPNCSINRPVYGILDVWRLGLPFPDSRQGVAQQAVVLNGSEASVRAILHAGEMLSALPGPNATDLHPFDVNPQEFGTLSHIQHIALRWLQSFSSADLAIAAAEYLSQSPTQPPPSASPLLNSTMPVIEVAFFGEVLLQSDVSSFVSDLSTPTGELFFGSSQGEAFRRWALQPSSPSTITWTNSALAQQVVVETQTVNSKFESVWTGSSNLIAHGPTNSSSVQRVVDTFNALGLFSS